MLLGIDRVGAFGQVFREQILQDLDRHGLGRIVRKALRDQLVPGSRDRVGGERYDGHLLDITAAERPDALHRFDAVHLRHHLVHEDDIVLFLRGHRNGLCSAVRGIGNDPVLLQVIVHELEIDLIVIDHEDLCVGCREGLR